MKREFFDEFPALWDAYEKQLKDPMVKGLAAKAREEAGSGKTNLSSIYWKVGCNYWWSNTGTGYRWKTQLEEVFFEYHYYDTIKQLDNFSDLDVLVTQRMEGLNTMDAQSLYRLAVKPLLDERKQTLTAAFAEMEKELNTPQLYVLKIPVDGQETELTLGFQKRYRKKKHFAGMDGYTYTFNGRSYRDVDSLWAERVEKLAENVLIGVDKFGERVLLIHYSIPTFDSSDREWNSGAEEYLMYDGKDIHLVTMAGGYRIAQLTFYEKLLTADSRMMPIFEKLGWPLDGTVWT